MIHPDTMIQWMDVDAGEVITGPVKDLFQKYSLKAEYKTLNVHGTESTLASIAFNSDDNPRVKITDGYGWTDILCLYKKPKYSYWRNIILGRYELMVTRFTFVPTFVQSDIDNPKTGFHGEIKYPYTIKSTEQIREYDFIRIFDTGLDNEGFIQPIIDNFFDTGIECEYDITTKSRFFNANKIHMFGDLIMTEEEKWNFIIKFPYGVDKDKMLEERKKCMLSDGFRE